MSDAKKIKVMHVVQSTPNGGVGRYIQMLFKYINHDEFENILVSSYDYKESDYYGAVIIRSCHNTETS